MLHVRWELLTPRLLIAYLTAAAGIVAMNVGQTQAQTIVRTSTLTSVPGGRDPWGVWSNNTLVSVENHRSKAPILHVYDQDGREVDRVVVEIPDAELIGIYNNSFTRSSDGYLAVSGSAYTNSNLGAIFLCIIAPDRSKRIIVRTSPYVPYALVFSPDGTIWTAGRELAGGNDVTEEYLIIRRFDRNGKFIGGAVPRSRFAAVSSRNPVIGSHLIASKDRIGWFSPITDQYIEFALDGRELVTYTHNISALSGIAMCNDNSVFASSQAVDETGKKWLWTVKSLDRQHNTWFSSKPQSKLLYLYGCNGTDLATNSGKLTSIEWLAMH